jgi:adenosylhomocysteinase
MSPSVHKSLDEEVAQYMVEGFGGTLTRMTAEQSEYLGVLVDGPFKPDEYRY